MSNNENSLNFVLITHFIRSNKYPLLITLGFFLSIGYASFFAMHYWFSDDGLSLLQYGEAIVHGDGWNVTLFGEPPGGPVLFAILNSFFHNVFFTEKLISLISGSGIVLFSYYIIKNIFNSKIALVGQLFFAFNPHLILSSTAAMNELLPIFLISVSLYFITKKHLKLSNLIIFSSLLGVSFMIRYQSIYVLFAIVVFLLIHDKKIRTNLSYCVLITVFFLIVSSPVIIYNYSTYGTAIDSQPAYYLAWKLKYQTPELHDKLLNMLGTDKPSFSSAIFLDFNLYLKSYFYNLFYNAPNRLFDFDTFYNLSILPLIPFLGIIPFVGGLIYSFKMNFNKTNLTMLFGTALVTAFFVFLFGDFKIHFFAVIIIPLLVLGIRNIKNIEKNFLPLLIVPLIYLPMISLVTIYKVEHLFPMWILIPTLNAVFFIDVIPKISSKIKKVIPIKESESINPGIKKISLVLIILILLINLGFSYRLLEGTYYEDKYAGIKNEFSKLFQKKEMPQSSIVEIKQIGEFLSKQPGIENSYVMADRPSYSYYAHSKLIYNTFEEGIRGDTIDKYVTRENWSPDQFFLSNAFSYPVDRHNIYKAMPNYLIYDPRTTPWDPWIINKTQFNDLKILSDPNNPGIPSNFKAIYISNKTGEVIYKISH